MQAEAQAAAQKATEAAQKAAERAKTPDAPTTPATGSGVAAQQPVKAPVTTPVAPPPKVERKKTISIKTVTSQYSWQIKTEEDIDKYLRELRTKLLGVLEEDTTVNIEF